MARSTPGLRGLTFLMELVRNAQLMTFRPLTRTVNSTETRGTIAMTNVEYTSVVASRSTAWRLPSMVKLQMLWITTKTSAPTSVVPNHPARPVDTLRAMATATALNPTAPGAQRGSVPPISEL